MVHDGTTGNQLLRIFLIPPSQKNQPKFPEFLRGSNSRLSSAAWRHCCSACRRFSADCRRRERQACGRCFPYIPGRLTPSRQLTWSLTIEMEIWSKHVQTRSDLSGSFSIGGRASKLGVCQVQTQQVTQVQGSGGEEVSP